MAKKKGEATPANGQQRPAPAYFLSLNLENVRCFGKKQTLDLSDGAGKPARWTVLLGNNGTGKTTVLQALVAFDHLFHALNEPNDSSRIGRSPGLRLGELHRLPRHPESPAAVRATFALDTQPAEIPVARPESSVGLTVAGKSIHYSFPGHESVSPPRLFCCAYGAARRVSASSGGEGRFDDPTGTLFSESAELRNTEGWLLSLDYSASKRSPSQPAQDRLFSQICHLLVDLLPDVDAVRCDPSSGVFPDPHVVFKTPFGWVPMRQLGYGYQTVIAWMVDLASRMVERYPDSPDPLAEPVIVLVDEIDLHLHPTWQRSLIAKLDERFPRAQFIVTAHSPLVVQAAPNANLAVLRRDGDHVVIDNDVDAIRNWRVDQILTSELFGLPTARPPQIEKDMARRVELLSKSRMTAADKREVVELEARIGHLPMGETAEQARMMELLQRSLDLMSKEQPIKP